MQLLSPSAQAYAWGSRTLIQKLRGEEQGTSPIAELWYGAHPGGPSQIGDESLAEHIAAAPEQQLGHRVHSEFGERLPFLLKILAADQPLSLQAHPSLEQAQEGFARDNEQGIQLGAHNRNYKDDNHKPELLIALTEFHAMAGFRPLAKTLEMLRFLDCEELERYIAMVVDNPLKESDNLRALFTTWITIPTANRRNLIAAVVASAKEKADTAPEWMSAALKNIVLLNEQYPGDVGVLGAILLNYVVLQPGEAIYLDAGNLHAYVRGLGVEIMANSDNVLRGGLTSKHVDVPELVRVLKFASLEDPIVEAESGVYPVPINEFAIKRFDLDNTTEKIAHDGPAILLCTDGTVEVDGVTLSPTQALWLSAADAEVEARGQGQLFVATV